MNMPIAPVAAGTTTNPMTAGASPAAASPLGGFEALLAALFSGEGAQIASSLAKTTQSADGDASAESSADPEALVATDPAAALTLLAAFAMAPAPIAPMIAQPSAQGEGAEALGAIVSNVPPFAAQAVPAESVAAGDVPAPAQADPKEALFAPAAGPSANGPGLASEVTATAAAAGVLPTDGEAAPQNPALQALKADPADAPSSQPAASAPSGPQAPQLVAASLQAQKPVARQGQAPDAQPSASTVEGVVEPDAAATADAAGLKPSA
jgi:hypothetical protein